jgi:hypothetical protein
VVDPSSLDLGDAKVGTSKDTLFTVKNTGGGLLTGNVSESAPDYSVVSGGGLFALGPGESLTVDVRFEPTVIGTVGCLVDLGTMDNRMVYVADNASGLHVFDAKNPVDPVSVGAEPTADLTYGVFILGRYAYVADGLAGLRILDIADPSNPVPLGSQPTPHRAQDVFVSDGYAYVTAYSAGLRVINVANPLAPSEVANVTNIGYAYGIDVSGDHAYVAVSDSGVVVIDVSDPENPTQAGRYDTPVWAWDIEISGQYAYVADGWGLIILDVSDPSNPAYEGGYFIGPWSYGVCVLGDYAYLGNSTEGLTVIDVSDPTNPVLHGSCDTPGFAFGVAVEGPIAYVADGDSGVQVIDVSDPSSPTILKTLGTPGVATRLAVRNGGDVFLRGIGQNPLTGIGTASVPAVFALYQNVPNPFNPATVIRYDVPSSGGKVTIRIYDVAGRLVRTLADAVETPGEKRVTWNGRNNQGARVATGVYFYRMTAPGFVATKKIVLLQ